MFRIIFSSLGFIYIYPWATAFEVACVKSNIYDYSELLPLVNLLDITPIRGGPRLTQPKDENPAFWMDFVFLVKFKFWTSALPDTQGLGDAGRVWKRQDQEALAPPGPLSEGPVLGSVAVAAWEGSAPRMW